MISDFISVSALSSLAVQQQVSANNLANVNTPGFNPSRVDLQTGPLDQGVQVGAITQEDGQLQETAAPTSPEGLNQIPSRTDLVQEMVKQITTSTYFAANTKPIQTQNDMLGSLINIFV